VYHSPCSKEVSSYEDCEIKISFLNDNDDLTVTHKLTCPFKINGPNAHAFCPGVKQICGDTHFDNESFSNEKTKTGDGKYHYFPQQFTN